MSHKGKHVGQLPLHVFPLELPNGATNGRHIESHQQPLGLSRYALNEMNSTSGRYDVAEFAFSQGEGGLLKGRLTLTSAWSACHLWKRKYDEIQPTQTIRDNPRHHSDEEIDWIIILNHKRLKQSRTYQNIYLMVHSSSDLWSRCRERPIPDLRRASLRSLRTNIPIFLGKGDERHCYDRLRDPNGAARKLLKLAAFWCNFAFAWALSQLAYRLGVKAQHLCANWSWGFFKISLNGAKFNAPLRTATSAAYDMKNLILSKCQLCAISISVHLHTSPYPRTAALLSRHRWRRRECLLARIWVQSLPPQVCLGYWRWQWAALVPLTQTDYTIHRWCRPTINQHTLNKSNQSTKLNYKLPPNNDKCSGYLSQVFSKLVKMHSIC